MAGRSSMASADVDRGWAWVVLGASFVAYLVGCGIFYNIGSYFVVFLDAFQESRSYTAWIAAVLSAAFQLAGFLSSVILSRLGARGTLFLGGLSLALSDALLFQATSFPYVATILGIFGGVGAFLICAGCIAAIAQSFNRRLQWAMGIMSSGAGLGMAFVGVFIESMIEAYGWRGSLLIVSGAALQVCVCAALIRDRGGRSGRKRTDDAQPRPSLPLGRDPRFWFLCVASALWNLGAFPLYTCFKDILRFQGIDVDYRTFIAWLGAGQVVGRVSIGFIAARFDPLLTFCPVTVVCATGILAILAATDAWLFCALGFLFGACHGQFCVLHWLQMAEVFGKNRMAAVWGYVLAVGSVGGIVGPPFGGYLVDVSQSYVPSLTFFAGSILCSGGFTAVVYCFHHKHHHCKGPAILGDGDPRLAAELQPSVMSTPDNSEKGAK